MKELNLFEYNYEKQMEKNAPLAQRMRPENLADFYGQSHVVGEGKLLNRLIKADKIHSMIFYGPPGTGKTTLARIISKHTRMVFEQISAVTSGVKDLRLVSERAKETFKLYNKRTIVFVDEIHRFNKSQQDTLLPYVEDGSLILIGATTENPYFEVNKALNSRCQIIELQALQKEDIIKILQKAIKNDKVLKEYKINLEKDLLLYLAQISSGDARMALNSLEIAVLSTDLVNGEVYLNQESIENSLTRPMFHYDKGSDEHYNIISAFIKSMRGSDPDAALYYLARMLEAGEDIKFIARRMIIFASEDIGNADPNALMVANNVFQGIQVVGMPEASLILAQGVIYLTTAEKNNSSYLAIEKAIFFVKKHPNAEVPSYLKDAHYDGAKDLERGIGYLYPHSYEDHYVKQGYLPKDIENVTFYEPQNIGYEQIIINYLKKNKRVRK